MIVTEHTVIGYGHRLLAALSNTQDPDITAVRCDPTGCSIETHDTKPPNWGIAMGTCVHVPEFFLGQEQDIGHTDKYECKHNKDPGCDVPIETLTPTSPVISTNTITPTHNPTQTPTPTLQTPNNECIGNILPNGSYEINVDEWVYRPNRESASGAILTNEGIYCSDASHGACCTKQVFDSQTGPYFLKYCRIVYYGTAANAMTISGPAGTEFTLSYDTKLQPNSTLSATFTSELAVLHGKVRLGSSLSQQNLIVRPSGSDVES